MPVERRLNGLETAVRRQRIIIAAMILLMVELVTIADHTAGLQISMF